MKSNIFNDDFFYPLYLEYRDNRKDFYNNHITQIKDIYTTYSNGGKFWFTYTIANNGDKCFAVTAIYKDRIIKNRVGYNDMNIALMSMVDVMRNNLFDKVR